MKKLLLIVAVALTVVSLGWASGRTPSGTPASDGVDLEVWFGNTGFQAVEKGSPVYEWYKEKTGVGLIMPYVEWNGGSTYLEQLNLKIAAGEMPDMFLPWAGVETRLIQEGALLDLSDRLPKDAPNVWNVIPPEVWGVMRSYDPTGGGGIYTIPSVVGYGRTGGMIRKDWLDKVGLPVPTTVDEYVAALKAFATRDPNGNGRPDEIPTGGRQNARWMDHLFAPFGVAMQDGFPQFDTYNGELTFSAVTPNMKAALEFIRGLYADGLMDPETLLNSKQDWEGKIRSNRVGSYFHWVQYSFENLEPIQQAFGIQGDYVVIPPLEGTAFDGFYSHKQISGLEIAVKNQDDEQKLSAVFEVLNWVFDEDNWLDIYLGLEGMHHEVVNGTRVRLPEDKTTQQAMIFAPFQWISTIDFQIDLTRSTTSEERSWAIEQGIRNLQELQPYVRVIASDGMPGSVYEGFPDIQGNTLYFEYASRIILGELPLSAFDEFVDRWYATGGREVTDRARAWYASATE